MYKTYCGREKSYSELLWAQAQALKEALQPHNQLEGTWLLRYPPAKGKLQAIHIPCMDEAIAMVPVPRPRFHMY